MLCRFFRTFKGQPLVASLSLFACGVIIHECLGWDTMKKKKTGVRVRSAPRRSAAQWAREFAEALALGPGVTVSRTEFLAAAKKDSRLRERRPDLVVRIVEAGAKVSGVSLEEWVLLGRSCSWLLVRKPEAIGMILKELEDVLGIKRRDAVRLVKKVPALVSFGRGRIKEKFDGLCGVFDFEKGAVKRLVLRCPDFLVRKTGLLAGRVEEESLLFGFSGEDYRKLLRRDPRLLLRDEKVLFCFLENLGKEWRLTEGEVRGLVMKAPGILFSGSLARIDGNVNKLARGLGWKKAEAVRAVMKFPVLAYQNPERVIGNFRKGASALGVEREVLAKAVCGCPVFLRGRWRVGAAVCGL